MMTGGAVDVTVEQAVECQGNELTIGRVEDVADAAA